MNSYLVNSFYTKTHVFKQKHTFLLKSMNILSTHSTTTTLNNFLSKKDTPHLPFLIKVSFLKTVRNTIPTISYQYILPQQRQLKSNSYTLRLLKNYSSSKSSLEGIYATLLKI